MWSEPLATLHLVIPDACVDHIVATTGDDRVIAACASDVTSIIGACEGIVALGPSDQV